MSGLTLCAYGSAPWDQVNGVMVARVMCMFRWRYPDGSGVPLACTDQGSDRIELSSMAAIRARRDRDRRDLLLCDTTFDHRGYVAATEVRRDPFSRPDVEITVPYEDYGAILNSLRAADFIPVPPATRRWSDFLVRL